MRIDDGTGKGYQQKVDANNRALVRAVNTAENLQATSRGDSYNINTGVITLTNDSETPVMYLKNNENRDLHIVSIAIGLGTETGGIVTDPVRHTIIRNPTTGTIVSNAIAVDIISNRNYGSSNTLTADAYKGATGNTLTDGTGHILFFQPDFGRLFASIDEILTKGDSIGIKTLPTFGNSSLAMYCAIICHLEDPNDG